MRMTFRWCEMEEKWDMMCFSFLFVVFLWDFSFWDWLLCSFTTGQGKLGEEFLACHDLLVNDR